MGNGGGAGSLAARLAASLGLGLGLGSKGGLGAGTNGSVRSSFFTNTDHTKDKRDHHHDKNNDHKQRVSEVDEEDDDEEDEDDDDDAMDVAESSSHSPSRPPQPPPPSQPPSRTHTTTRTVSAPPHDDIHKCMPPPAPTTARATTTTTSANNPTETLGKHSRPSQPPMPPPPSREHTQKSGSDTSAQKPGPAHSGPAAQLLAEMYRKQGSDLYKVSEFSRALEAFEKSFQFAPKDWPLHAQVLGNRAATLMMLHRYAEAAADCAEALKLDPTMVKLHARRGRALLRLGKTLPLSIHPRMTQHAL